ncbi:hypothetical protein PWT90_09545 [Aphanocladium album]|nr:hypothetical protein PWT90_09545 [Aphanocladium album]
MKKEKKSVAIVTKSSPYASNTVQICFGPQKEGPLRIPYDILKLWPALHKEANKSSVYASYEMWLKEVDVFVGHVIIDYLHRGQCDIHDGASENEAATAFATAVGAHKAANDFEMPQLAQMTFEKAYKLGDNLPLSAVIKVTLSNYEKASASDEVAVSKQTATSNLTSEYLTSRVSSMLKRQDRTVEALLRDIGLGEDPISTLLRELVHHVVLPSQGDEVEVPPEFSEMSDFGTVASSTGGPTATLSVQSFDGPCDFQQEHLKVGGAWESCTTCSDLVKRLARTSGGGPAGSGRFLPADSSFTAGLRRDEFLEGLFLVVAGDQHCTQIELTKFDLHNFEEFQ